jgi:hypothetical protein
MENRSKEILLTIGIGNIKEEYPIEVFRSNNKYRRSLHNQNNEIILILKS